MLLAAFFPPGWDPALPSIGQLFARGVALCSSTRLRRYTLLPGFLQLCLLAVAVAFPTEAQAAVTPPNPVLWALGVTDSYGVPLSRYTMSTDYGTILDGGTRAVLASILEMEAAFFVAVGGVAIWFFTRFALNFEFLRTFFQPVAVLLQDYAARILPGVAAIAAVIAAIFIAVNVLRENYPRAAAQAGAAVIVAALAGSLTYSPVSWVMSEAGPVIQGRNVAVSLAAQTPATTVGTQGALTTLEGQLATSFVRRPLQIWNFSASPDATPACAKAWTDGVNSGNPDNIKDGIKKCGSPDSAVMKAAADNPNAGQLGTGALLILFITVFALFCAVLGFHIIMEFANALMNAVKLLWNFAIGVIPGAPQSSLVNTFVAVLYSFVAMLAYVTLATFVGMLVMSIFETQGNGIVAMISALVAMVASLQVVSRVSKGLKSSSVQTAANIAGSIGTPAIPNTTNILHEKTGGFLRATTVAAVGIPATVAGMALAKRSPAAAAALNTVAPFLGKSALASHMTRGTKVQTARNVATLAANSTKTAPSDDPPQNPPEGGDPPTPPPSSGPPPTTPPPGGGPPAGPSHNGAPPPPATAPAATPPAPATSTPPPPAPATTLASPTMPTALTHHSAGSPSSPPAPPRTGSPSSMPEATPTPTPPPPPAAAADNTPPRHAAAPSPFETTSVHPSTSTQPPAPPPAAPPPTSPPRSLPSSGEQ